MSPPMKADKPTVGVEVLDGPDRGLWCPVCAEHTVVRCTVAPTVDGEAQGSFDMAWCTSCGQVPDALKGQVETDG